MLWQFPVVWQTADKIVYSQTLETASTRKTQIVRSLDLEAIRQLKESAEQDILIGGAELATRAFRSWLIDEYHLFIYPIITGGGKPALPENIRVELKLLEERRFRNGVVYLYRRTRPGKTI